jgi:hypothetical protein
MVVEDAPREYVMTDLSDPRRHCALAIHYAIAKAISSQNMRAAAFALAPASRGAIRLAQALLALHTDALPRALPIRRGRAQQSPAVANRPVDAVDVAREAANRRARRRVTKAVI